MEPPVKRILLCLALALLVVGSAAAPASATLGQPSGWVSWVVNHRARTITVTAKLQIYLGPCSPITVRGAGRQLVRVLSRDCSATAATISKAIKDDIEKVWNGHYYTCYRLIFVVDVSVTDNRFTVDADRVGVNIDRSPEPIRAHVNGTLESAVTTIGDWQSNDPADRIEVDNSAINPTEVGYPPANPNTYAHEFGHMLGLHDTYTWWSGDLKTGAPADLMFSSRLSNIAPSTINRVVERNRDRLVDSQGRKVDLEDLVCERQFRAWLQSGEPDYQAAHLQNSAAAAPCSRAAFTTSTTQQVDVDSQGVDLNLVETSPQPGSLGYLLVPVFDKLTLQGGLTGGGRRAVDIGMFDLPIDVAVQRTYARPASGQVPPVYDLASPACADAPGGGNNRLDCGSREYNSWIAIALASGNQIWPIGSVMPRTLRDVGRSSQLLALLYQNCPGPEPWPGWFAEDQRAAVTPGLMPPLADLWKVSDDWTHDKKPGKVEIDGHAELYQNVPGGLKDYRFTWTLTLCPLNKDGEPPPNCP
jgi:hypothetical protein